MSALDSPPVIGFIGLGDQGLPMATAIAEGGYALQVWALNPITLDPWVPCRTSVIKTPRN